MQVTHGDDTLGLLERGVENPDPVGAPAKEVPARREADDVEVGEYDGRVGVADDVRKHEHPVVLRLGRLGAHADLRTVFLVDSGVEAELLGLDAEDERIEVGEPHQHPIEVGLGIGREVVSFGEV